MDRITSYIAEQLKNKDIKKDFSSELNRAISDNVISENMPLDAAYTAFLIKFSNEFPVLNSVLKNGYLYDISFTVPGSDEAGSEYPQSKIKEDITKLKKIFANRSEYIHTEDTEENKTFIGIKFNKNAYDSLKNDESPVHLIPYRLISEVFNIEKLNFDQRMFDYKNPGNVGKKFAELIEHLKTCDIPLSIVDYDSQDEHTSILKISEGYIYLQDNGAWPDSSEAVECAKTAFYCQFYAKSSHSVFLDKNYVVFKYKNIYFKVKILIKRDFNIKYNVMMELQSILNRMDASFHRKVRIIKTLLANIGFYPILIDDFLIDLICLINYKNIIGDAKFVEDFLSFDFDLNNKKYILEELKFEPVRLNKQLDTSINQLKVSYKDQIYNCILPKENIMLDLKNKLLAIKNSNCAMFDKNLVLQTHKLLSFDFYNYTFILSKNKIDGFKKINNIKSGEFLLGVPSYDDFVERFRNKGTIFYFSPTNEILLVKVEGFENIGFYINSMVSQTFFEYIKIN